MPFDEIKYLIVRTHKVSIEVNSIIFETLLLRGFISRLAQNIKDDAADLRIFIVDEASKTSLSRMRERDWSSREVGGGLKGDESN